MVERYKILRKWDKVLQRGCTKIGIGGIGGGRGIALWLDTWNPNGAPLF